MNYFMSILILMSVISFSTEASTIQWQNCSDLKFRHWFKDPPNPKLQCGHLDVPLKYISGTSLKEQDFGSHVRLALTRLPAKGVSKGSLLIISGGPGYFGINPWVDIEGSAKKIHESWDIVGYDPRGVGQSKPIIDCTIIEEPSTPENYNKDLINACVKYTGIDILKHMGTDEAASDVDRIRQAVGDKKLSAIAYSYGTQVGLIYAERFPNNVRAMVLDGVVDIDEAKDSYSMRENQERGYQATFERFAAWCSRTKKCPLSADKSVATQQYVDLLNKLHSTPLSRADGQQVSANELKSLTTSLLIWHSSWPDLATAVRQLSKGVVGKKVEQILGQQESDSISYLSEDALNVISCVDFSPSGLSQDDILYRRRKIKEAFPAINFQPQEPDPVELCDMWPWKSNFHSRRPASIPALPQLLFVAQRHDPTTPWQNARTMATQFKGTLITLEGDGHTLALSGKEKCVDKAIIDYLNAPDKKQDDKSCHRARH
ncbi:pimeloyl-ACP methyl ester carboxylesterase [Chromobacterium alkanivorans]|uniref:alpha/beta hydrolase n=1 Tax=Chromobacterium alkanivorans TaxID=1071719 RepID=UPI00216896C7|nr:alpha/beta hydrolase [Chromobacterium alkanivorans]MCS3803903.1 pimeloyl-ACP methyl ester carboxylesterase [Chromobacterium alkanivorans]MCS3817992.1 pimeloyl-ACP methyl ester carboxylesterase [Chromobacterium alkanivorans]MCS3875612.1 pimeloyl-ACP methyl ester carboxylesterase [Chromobacterium alkanivorans]